MKTVDSQHGATTRLTGRRLALARAIWLGLTIIYLAMLAISLPLYWDKLLSDPYGIQNSLAQIGLTLQFFVVYVIVLNCLVILALMGMAILIFLRKSDDWMALLVSLMMVAICAVTLPISGVLTDAGPVIALFYHAMRALGVGIGLLVLFIFPDGRFVPGWARYMLALWFIYGLAWLFFPQLAPLAAPADMRTIEQLRALAVTLIFFGAGLFAQVYRYTRVADPVQRQQTKWVVFGFAMFMVGMFSISLPIIFVPALRQPGAPLMVYLLIEIPFVLFCLTLVPLTIMISILKYQLWDIDALIRRTLAYSVLTATLAVFYFASVLFLQALFDRLIGQADNLALVGSTLAIAALFNPLRGRIQGNIDRRFYRQKYDAEKLIMSFGSSLRDEVEIDQLAARLLNAARDTFQPEGAELWLVDAYKDKSVIHVTRSSIFPRRL
jgi:hypothetical protein